MILKNQSQKNNKVKQEGIDWEENTIDSDDSEW